MMATFENAVATKQAPNLRKKEGQATQKGTKKRKVIQRNAAQSNKKVKKMFINETLFGSNKTLLDSSSENGISHLKIKAQELGNIPGLIGHWQKEIDMRVKEIRAFEGQTFLQRSIRILKREAIPLKISGEEIARLHPTKPVLEKVKILKRTPSDMMNRLELVSIVAKSGRDFTVEQYRNFLLEATISCYFGKWNNIGLQVVIWTQEMYFSKLYNKCKGEAFALQDKLKATQGQENAFTRQSSKLKQHISDLKRNMEIIKSFQKQTEKALKDNKAVYNATLSINEIAEFLIEEGGSGHVDNNSKKDDRKMSILKRASEILLLLRVLPLLESEAKQLASQLKKMDKNDPIVYFLEAKISMTNLILKVGQYQGGEKTSKLRSEIQNAFKDTHLHYGIAVKKVGKSPKTKLENTIFIEYVSLIHYFYKISKTTLGVALPKEWLRSIFNKTLIMLRAITEKGAVDNLMMDIQKDMVDEEIDVATVRA